MHKHRRPTLATAVTAAPTGGLLTTAVASSTTAADSVEVAKAGFTGDAATSAPGA
ncbi:hypothetical protein [Streptomyces sp. NPDC006640]|uniref:hypothetical protein n=1 Tax=unclassified Streptomyces TaxID=2593676 RepID=UPI0036C9169B